VAFISCI